MFGADWRVGEVLEMRRAGSEGLWPWSGTAASPAQRRQGEGGRGGRMGCCLWANAMGDLAQTQQLD